MDSVGNKQASTELQCDGDNWDLVSLRDDTALQLPENSAHQEFQGMRHVITWTSHLQRFKRANSDTLPSLVTNYHPLTVQERELILLPVFPVTDKELPACADQLSAVTSNQCLIQSIHLLCVKPSIIILSPHKNPPWISSLTRPVVDG